MPNRPWTTFAAQWGLWFVLMSLVMGWLSRSRMRPRAAGEANVMRYPLGILILGIVCSGFFVALAVLSYLFPGKTGSPIISLSFLGFALLGVPMILEYHRVRHEVVAGGLSYQTMLGKRGLMTWAEVRQLRYSESSKGFRVVGTRGEIVRISAMLTALPAFARAALDGVPRQFVDPKALPVLEATAAGSPPSIWG
jgi:hypothetical protein